MLPAVLLGAVLSAPPATDGHRDAVARFGAAVWNVRRERLLTAARQLEEAARHDPDAIAPLRELVRVYSLIGREPSAIRVAREVLAKEPGDVDTAHMLARLLFDAGQLEEAIAAAKLAARAPLPPSRTEKLVGIYRDLATLCEKAGDQATAEASLGKAIELLVDRRDEIIEAGAFTPREADTAAAESLEQYGKVLAKRRKFDEAVKAYTEAARLYRDPLRVNEPSSAARLEWNLSGVCQAKGDPVRAMIHLQAFLKLRPTAPEPYARLAQLLRESDREGEVIDELGRHAAREAGNLSLQAVYAAELYRRDETRREGLEKFSKLLASTNEPKVVEIAIRAYLDSGRPGEVVAEIDRAFGKLEDKESDAAGGMDFTAREEVRAFSAERLRLIAAMLERNVNDTVPVVRSGVKDLGAGVKRHHRTAYYLGQLAAHHRRLELAAHYFREAIQNAPAEPSRGREATQGLAYQGLIDVLSMAGKSGELADVCQRALLLREPPRAPHYLYFHLAGALAELGDSAGALAAADKAIQLTADGDRLTVRLRKLQVLRLLGRSDEAIVLGKKLFEEFEASADRLRVRYALSGAYWGAGKAAEAEAELRSILEVDPDHAAACNDLGFHLADQSRNLDEAERLIRNAIAQDRFYTKKLGSVERDNAAYIDSLGWVLFRRGRLADARLELERAAALPDGANDAAVWDHLGDVLFRLNEKAKAKAAWEKVVELCEKDPGSLERARREGRLDEVKLKLKRLR
jgi:tetratricopeptide (TPR) repeat protein